jgi:histidinol phosphatase-like enzyme
VDGVYYCPHHPSVGLPPYRSLCDCRKPKAGMITTAAADLGLSLSCSYVVGDQIIDMEAASQSGARGIWIRQVGNSLLDLPKGVVRVVNNLWEAACWVRPADDSQSQNGGEL